MEESTPLSKTFADQGLKIRIRKEVRIRGKTKKEEPEIPSKKRIREEETTTERSSSSSRNGTSAQSAPPRPVYAF